MIKFLPFLAPIFAIAIFSFVLFVLSRLGWHDLVKKYAYKEVFIGNSLDVFSARINWVNYNGVINFSFNEHGLYLEVFFIFKLFHPPVFIPWSEIHRVSPSNVLFFKRTALSIGHLPTTEIIIKTSALDRIEIYLKHALKK